MLRMVLCLALPVLSSADVKVMEEIIAKVNGDIITRTDVNRTREQLRAQLEQRSLQPGQLETVMKQQEAGLLSDRIDQLLLIQKGKELNVNVDADVSRRLADIQRDSGIADPEKFQTWLREQAGMSFEDFRSEMKNGLMTQRVVQQEVGGKINIPRQEVRDYYEKNKAEFVRQEQVFLREILVSTEGKDEAGVAAAERKAKELVARARRGEKFPEMARDHSDAASKSDFGALAPQKRGDMRKDLEDMVFAMNKNEVTDSIKVANGFLILKVEEKHQAGQAALEEVDNEIMEKLYQPRFQPKIREYLTQLRSEAFLEIKDGFVDSNAAPGKNTTWSDPAQLKPETVTKEEVAAAAGRKRLLWLLPLPWTKEVSVTTSK
ncbi:MAG: peptidylprolyl isomerase [Bryobacteraceae bacterium]